MINTLKTTKKLVLHIGISLWICELINGTPLPNDHSIVVERRDMKLTEHNNSLYVRDVVRSSKGAEMRNYIDTTKEPCRNFFQFACGNWLQLQPTNVRNEFQAYTADLMITSYKRKINTILQLNVDDVVDTENDKKLKNFYESCVNLKDWRTARNRKKLKEIINEFGEMPALAGEQWHEENFDWLETVANISHRYGINIILRMAIEPDIMANSPINRIFMHIPETLLITRINNIYYLLNELLGIDMATVDKMVPDILKIEISLKPENGRDVSVPKLFTVDQLQQKYMPLIDLKKYLNLTLGQDVFHETIYELSEEHHKRITHMLPQITNRDLANYIFYKLIDNFQIKNENTERKQRDKCAKKTRKYFSKHLDNMLYRKYNNIRTERDLSIIWNSLKRIFRVELGSSNLYWINEMTRELAIDKLDAMRLEINTFEENANEREELDDLNFTAHDFIENMKMIKKVQQQNYLAEWQQPAKRTYEATYTTPRIFHHENVIRIPVSFLQPHLLWDEHYPYALKFATLGTMIAHELVHGFDEKGHTYDINGEESTWWDKTSQRNFFDRVNCLDEQFEGYLLESAIRTPLLRTAVQPEIVAENSGVSLAYLAYLNWYDDKLETEDDSIVLELEILPNLKYTNRQLFFISFAQLWCEDRNIWTALYNVDEDQVPAEFRVNAPLQNLNAFGKEFNCRKGSTHMNPIQKCEIY